MRVLHLFDEYLPTTLSWVNSLLAHLPDVCIEVGGAWQVADRPDAWVAQRVPNAWQRRVGWGAAREFEAPRVRSFFLKMQRYWPQYRHQLARQLGSRPPDLIHAHFGPIGCLYQPLAARWDVPLVVSFYGFDYTKTPQTRPIFFKKYQKLFDAAACVVAASEAGGEVLERLGCPPDKIAVIRPSIVPTDFEYAQRPASAVRTRLVQVASMTEKKGFDTTLDAFRLAVQTRPDLHLTLAGERVERAVVQQVAQRLQAPELAGCVDWLDPVPHHQVGQFLDRFGGFVHPSRYARSGDHEDTPVIILEALAVGLPVLTTPHFGIKSQVLDGYNGYVTPEGDTVALARSMLRLADLSADEYDRLRRQARQHVEVHFDVRQAATRLRATYAQVLAHIPSV
jgi:colanic acid/amylovoran biosynthesis glycosyltransferase